MRHPLTTRLALAVLIVLALGAGPACWAIVPIYGGLVPGTTIVIDNRPGTQTDSSVSGNLVVYSDFSSGSGHVRYRDLVSGASGSIPGPLGSVDTLADVSGSRISFSRQLSDRFATMVYDVVSGSLVEIAPQAGSQRFATALAGNTVAFVDAGASPNGELLVANLASPLAAPLNLSNSPTLLDGNPSLSPSGDAAVWESCDPTFTTCVLKKALYAGGAWGATQTVASGGAYQLDGETDGTYLSYQSGATGFDAQVFWQTLAGGAETGLDIPGYSSDPHISGGIITFQHRTSPSATSDLFAYVIATNTLYQLTDTPGIDEAFADVSVSADGEIHVAWSANSDPDGSESIFASLFRVPLAPVGVALPGTPALLLAAALAAVAAARSGRRSAEGCRQWWRTG